MIGVGLSGPGARLEETTPVVPPPCAKSRGRGRRKQRKKVSCQENLMGDAMKHDPMSESDMRNISEGVFIPGMQEEIPGNLNLLYEYIKSKQYFL